MENLSVDELSQQLKGHLAPELIQILKDQDITGSRFLCLTESTLKLFNFNLGHIIDIVALISAIKSGSKDITRKAGDGNESLLTDTTEPEPLKSSVGNTSGIENMFNDSDSDSCGESNEDPEKEKGEEVLQQYVKLEYLNSLSPYARLNLRKVVSNWLRLQEHNIPTSSRPRFPGVPKSAFIDPESSKENSPPKKKAKKQASRKSARVQMLKPTQQSSATSNEKPSGTRRQLVKPGGQEDDVLDGDGNDVDEEVNMETLSASMYKLPSDLPHLKTVEELSSEKPQIPSVEVEEILLKEEKTKALVPHLKAGFLFPDKTRKLIFRTLVRHMCYKYVQHPTKFTGTMREGLAKSFIVTYPQFQKLIPVPGQTSWSHILGHFQNIYKRVLTSLPSSERPRKGKGQKKKKTKINLTCDVNVDLLNVINPIPTNREEILDGMKKSYKLRVASRLNGDSITELIEKFPHFQHYEGEVLTQEFDMMFPKATDMVRTFTPLIPKVLEKFPAAKNLSPKSELDEMKVFLYLASLLPHSIDKDAPSLPKEKEILATVKAGKSVDEFVEEKRLKAGGAVQPYLIAIKGTATNSILKYFLVLDSFKVQLGNVTFLRAIDWLFKSYHVFNVHYPLSWKNFFRFLQACMYNVFIDTNDDVTASGHNLYSMLISL